MRRLCLNLRIQGAYIGGDRFAARVRGVRRGAETIKSLIVILRGGVLDFRA